MTANLLQIFILGLVQGAAELLPVSSSAHVIVAEKLLGLDPSAPEMTFLLVMLHTGTMFAVIVYFWRSWRVSYFSDWATFRRTLANVVVATVATGAVGLTLQQLIERVFLSHHGESAEVERLFSELPLIAAALFAVGLLIIYSGLREERQRGSKDVTTGGAGWIGIVQGLCLPFRGFSRSGATISTGLLLGIDKRRAEEFSFALAVVLTPVIIAKELIRLIKSQDETSHFLALLQPGLLECYQFSFRTRRALAAFALAGRRTLAILWLLLSGRGCRRLRPGKAGLLKRHFSCSKAGTPIQTIPISSGQ
jgi:undecaprenyl-diphosphatase